MGLLNGLSAWVGNSQVFALNSIADDSFALENLTYAVTNHTTTGIPHLYTLTNLYRSYGMVAGVGAVLALLVAILLVSRSQKDKKVSFLSIFPSLFNNGAPFMVGIPVLLNLLYVIPFLLIPLDQYGNCSSGFVLQTDASSCLSSARWDTKHPLCFYWDGRKHKSFSCESPLLCPRRGPLYSLCPYGQPKFGKIC